MSKVATTADWKPPPVPPAYHLTGSLNGDLLLLFGFVLAAVIIGMAPRQASVRQYIAAPFLTVGVILVGGIVGAIVGPLLFGPDKPGRMSDFWEFLRAVAAIGYFCALGFVAGRYLLRPTIERTHVRGTVIERQPDPPFSKATQERRARNRGTLTLGGYDVPELDETKHFKMIGTTGTGKSTAIRELVGGALLRGDRAIFADPDGGYCQRFYDPSRGDVILNPFDPRSRRWDLFSEIHQPYDYDELARALIADTPGGADRAWRSYAQTFFSAVARESHALKQTDASEFYRLLTAAPRDELQVMLEGTPAQPFLEAGNERMFGSIRSVTTNAVTALDFIRHQKTEPFAIRDWVRSGRGNLFLPYSARQIAALKNVISTWMRIAIFETMAEGEGDLHLWFVVDELDALGAIDGLKDALVRLRKFGGRCVLGFQAIAQVSGTYGESIAQSIVENCGNSLILRCSASENGGTARFASRLIGEREIRRQNITRSNPTLFSKAHASESVSYQHVTEFAVLPSEIEQLPDLQGFLRFASEPTWRRVKLQPR